jgi:hypothetical protein
MHYLNNNNNNNNHVIPSATLTIFILAIMFASIMITTPVAASTNDNNTNTTPTTTTITSSAPSSGLELSPQPVYEREATTTSVRPINQTHIGSTFSANVTLTLPNTTETINATSSGSSLISLPTQSAIGKETIMTEDGGETVIATFSEIFEFPPGSGNANGIAIAVLHTNSTDRLAPLNGTLVVGTDYLYPVSAAGFTTFWEWVPTPPPSLLPSPMNTTTS